MQKEKKLKIIIVGPQGSGKGTQAEMTAVEYKIANISTGVMFREAIKNQTDLGKAVQSIMTQGDLVPDKLTNELVKERLDKADCKRGFILDGYPRNLVQAEYLLSVHDISHVFEIWVSDKEAVKRISGRRMCSCGMTYHLEYNPPKIAGECDKCKGRLFLRDDDTEEAVKQRLKIYHQETEAIVSFFEKKGIHYQINGEQKIPAVYKDVNKILNGNNKKK